MLRSPEEEFADAAEARIAAAFSGRLTVGLAEAARILDVSEKILRRHAAQGSIAFVDLGHGRQRRRRRFTLGDVVAFLQTRRQREALPLPRRHRRAGGDDSTESFSEFVRRIARERGGAMAGTQERKKK